MTLLVTPLCVIRMGRSVSVYEEIYDNIFIKYVALKNTLLCITQDKWLISAWNTLKPSMTVYFFNLK